MIGKLLAATLGSFLLLEIFLRLLPLPLHSRNWAYDAVVGHRGPRNAVVELTDGVGSQYNRFGFRGPDPTPKSQRPDLFSVFVFGDSITEAVEVPWRRTFASRLEPLLAARLGRDVEVTNWASSDYGTAEGLLLYKGEARALTPDVVAVQFLGLNDFVNNGFAFAGRSKARSDFARPYLAANTPGAESSFKYLEPAGKWWRERSRIVFYVHWFATKISWSKAAPLPAPASIECGKELEAGVFLTDPGPEWDEAFAATARLAVQWKRVTEGGPRLLAFYVPSYFETHDSAWKRGMERVLAECWPGKTYDREQPERRFLEAFRAADIEAFSLSPFFRSTEGATKSLYLPDGHLSSAGHALVAEELARRISKRKTPVPAPRQTPVSRGTKPN